tara:strand:- start:1292 stop:1810 length:519 start_codon:yes stop_codon:yes gene_type:complete
MKTIEQQLTFKELLTKQFEEAKKYNLFFDGNMSRECNGQYDLYIGDIDFRFGDHCVNLGGEFKHIYPNRDPKYLTFNQAREYSCDVNTYDNLGRKRRRFLFEIHEHHKDNKPYVILTEFRQFNEKFKKPIDFLDLNTSIMLYWENQLTDYLIHGKRTGKKPKFPLRCVKYLK